MAEERAVTNGNTTGGRDIGNKTNRNGGSNMYNEEKDQPLAGRRGKGTEEGGRKAG